MIEQTSSSTQTSAYDAKDKTPKTSATDALVNKDMFLQLLVAQIKNQNPLSPTDGVQFLSQLAQFTSVEQSTQIRDEITAIHALLKQQASVTTDAAQKTADGVSGKK